MDGWPQATTYVATTWWQIPVVQAELGRLSTELMIVGDQEKLIYLCNDVTAAMHAHRLIVRLKTI